MGMRAGFVEWASIALRSDGVSLCFVVLRLADWHLVSC